MLKWWQVIDNTGNAWLEADGPVGGRYHLEWVLHYGEWTWELWTADRTPAVARGTLQECLAIAQNHYDAATGARRDR